MAPLPGEIRASVLQRYISFHIWVVPACLEAAGFLLIESSDSIPNTAHGITCRGLGSLGFLALNASLVSKQVGRSIAASMTAATAQHILVFLQITFQEKMPICFFLCCKTILHAPCQRLNILFSIVQVESMCEWAVPMPVDHFPTAQHGFSSLKGRRHLVHPRGFVCICYVQARIHLLSFVLVIIISPQYLHQ